MITRFFLLVTTVCVAGGVLAQSEETKTPSQMVFVMAPHSQMQQPAATPAKAETPPAPQPTAEQLAAAIAKERVAAEMAAKAAAEAAAREAAEKKRLEDKADEAARLKEISTKSFTLRYVNANEVADSLNETWGGATASDLMGQWKIGKVAQAFPDANVVLITAPNFIMDACEKVIADIDAPPQQVYIEARFVEVNNNVFHKLGIDWQMLDGMKGSLSLDAGIHQRSTRGVSSYSETLTDSGNSVNYTLNPNNATSADLSHINATIGMSELYVTLRALESMDDVRVFSNPKVIVSSGKQAVVDMTTKYPNVKITARRTTSGTEVNSLDLDMSMAPIPGQDKMMFANESFFSWGLSLAVTPRVSTNGLIHVEIIPTISSQTDWVTAGTTDDDKQGTISSRYPVLNVQRIVTEFNMSSGTTAVIGGLSRTEEQKMDNGIPYLRRIPYLGRLFGSKVRQKVQKDIIVLVTVGLVNPYKIEEDEGLPNNAVLAEQYLYNVRAQPGDRKKYRAEGLESLDLTPLDDQYDLDNLDPERRRRRLDKLDRIHDIKEQKKDARKAEREKYLEASQQDNEEESEL